MNLSDLMKLLQTIGPILLKLLEWFASQPKEQQEALIQQMKAIEPQSYDNHPIDNGA